MSENTNKDQDTLIQEETAQETPAQETAQPAEAPEQEKKGFLK